MFMLVEWSKASSSQYWELQDSTNNTFKVIPQQSDGTLIYGTGDTEYVRSSILGFFGPANCINIGLGLVLLSLRIPSLENEYVSS
ncbi:hypothetical protein HCN44_010329 [Aphidius gifuensis]|uniref:Uncharacterized protein n=1 Tax=Aphidius gifuensis TaxID=684658 RepID=A0A835CR98_APHGI|nr:hypothetical protein HCN44_010329 [Aphidius gifuensis]